MSLRSDSKKASMRDELKRLVTDFNEQLKPYVFISPDNSRDNITIKSDQSPKITEKTSQLPSIDEAVVFNKIEKINKISPSTPYVLDYVKYDR